MLKKKEERPFSGVAGMSTLNKELVFLILQFCDEEGFRETAWKLERESGFYFDMKYFEEMVLTGNWSEAEWYLSGFTNLDDNRYSTKIYFEIRKQSFFEALDSKDRAKALDILMKDLKVFECGNEDLFKEMTQLLTYNDIREHDSLSSYGDIKSARKIVMQELKKIIEANPLFHEKLNFPCFGRHRLRRLINQGLNWQHILCERPCPNPDIKTLFVDHVCEPDNDSPAESTENNPLPSQTTQLSVLTPPSSSSSSPSTLTQSTLRLESLCLGAPTNPARELFEDFDISSKDSGAVDEVASNTSDPGRSAKHVDMPKIVALTLNEDSCPTSMDFHPIKQTLLLVGSSVGDVGLWDVSQGEKLRWRNFFRVWNIGACSMAFKAAFVKNPCISVNHIMWSPDGSLFGAAYSKHIVQLYSHSEGDDVQPLLEIDAHVGGVNDLAFSFPEGQILVLTCGDDKTIKVWNVVTGNKQFTFEGHDTPVYSLCSHKKAGLHYFFSISVDGKIKAWLYDNMGSRIDYSAPGLGPTKMAYSADGQRLFSCGTNKDGESFLIEWNESEGCTKRTYQGLHKCPSSVVQFVTIKNQLLAAGDDHVIKFWDMDNSELLGIIDAEGDLPVTPRICFNKEGTMLAVVGNENKIKILATDAGLHLLQISEKHSVDALREISETLRKLAINPSATQLNAETTKRSISKNGDPENVEDVKSLPFGEASIDDEVQNLIEFDRPSQCQSLQLSAHVKVNKISRLIYTYSGNGILALASNGIHLLWKWPQNELNLTGKATAKVHPQFWQPKSGSQLMINILPDSNHEEAFPCFALSKNDSYLLSASGGIISLFNMIIFKTLMTTMPPPPAATCLAFHPRDNNIVAIGRDDSTILIYNVRSNKVKSKLMGHTKRVTGLAFSDTQNSLVSSGADAQIFIWNGDNWQKQNSTFLQIPGGEELETSSDTHIQLHQDHLHFLAVHKTHLAIYEIKSLDSVKKWTAGASYSPISHATFSCDSQVIYAGFLDGTIAIFDASVLELQCRINASAYLPVSLRCSSTVYPVVVAAHPQEATQFAVGLTNGEVHVLEPREPQCLGNWAHC
ncbi:Topless-related protein [Parasponia andersonii]|uniref:Topless-related protein n=1 Tax=Parasponia andersonii TaxID=3476 RepID=A0A2P5DDH7_PARAD|nr:Topless-related protein [Parasponia andersonii]